MRTAEQVDLDQLKKDTRILDILDRYGIAAERQHNGTQFMALCPFHDDKSPSLSVDPTKNVWHCFGCDKGGSVIDFVMEIECIDFRGAVQKLLTSNGSMCFASQLQNPSSSKASRHGVAPEGAKTEKRPTIDQKLLSDVIDYYHKTLSGKDPQGLDYLKSRGLADPATLKEFRVGYVNGTLSKVLGSKHIEALKAVGILNDKGNEFFYGCIVVPIFTETGEIGEMYGRSVTGSRHLYLPGPHHGVMNAKAAEVYPDGIILTEAILDALAVYAIGHKNVVPCYGTNGWTGDHAAMLKKHGVQKVFIAFDADQAGDTAAKKLADRLTADGIKCHRVHIPKELAKDLNEYVQALRKEGMQPEEVHQAFAELLRKAPQIGHKRPTSGGKTGNITLAEHTADMLVFQNCEVNYRLRGLFDNTGTSLRVVLSVNLQDSCHTDRFDLYTAKSRVGFAHRAGNRLELPPAKIEDDLNTLIPMLETLLAEGKGKAEEPKGPPPMSEAERQEALRLLRSKNLLQRISTDLETVGYVGEDQNKQLGYLIATSRKLDKPLSAIIRSESGAGKSFLMECVAELMPEEEVQYFSRLTPQSLYYMGENELVHKLLIVDERDGSEEAEYPIRTLQTRRKLTLAVPMKDASTGKIKTTMLTINGPIAYMESSTKLQINPENLNRCFEIYLDESEKQTERIYALQKRAHTPEGWKVDAGRAVTLRRHRNAQRLLAPVRVSIPYAKLLHFPASWTRGRRDHQRLLHLIEAVTFLHQEQREKKHTADSEEHIEATVDDYARAYDLARAAFTQALADMPRNARLLLSQIRAMVKDVSERLNLSERDYGFRRRDVREYTRLPDHQIKRAMRTLEELEYVTVRRGGRGGSFIYHLAADPREKDPLEGLTTPDELKQACTLRPLDKAQDRQAQDKENG